LLQGDRPPRAPCVVVLVDQNCVIKNVLHVKSICMRTRLSRWRLVPQCSPRYQRICARTLERFGLPSTHHARALSKKKLQAAGAIEAGILCACSRPTCLCPSTLCTDCADELKYITKCKKNLENWSPKTNAHTQIYEK